MADDWKPGDLALCVNAQPDAVDPLAGKLSVGRIYTVCNAGARLEDGVFSLCFRCLPSNRPGMGWGFSAWRFRKINPLTDEERDEFVADLRTKEAA